MLPYLPAAAALLLAAIISTPVNAQDRLKNRHGTVALEIPPAREKSETAYRSVDQGPLPDLHLPQPEIVIDKGGRRIGMAPGGPTDNHWLRMRSGRRVGSRIVDSAGRPVGILIGGQPGGLGSIR